MRVSVCLSVCAHSNGRIFDRFHQNWHRTKTCSLGSISHHPFLYFCHNNLPPFQAIITYRGELPKMPTLSKNQVFIHQPQADINVFIYPTTVGVDASFCIKHYPNSESICMKQLVYIITQRWASWKPLTTRCPWGGHLRVSAKRETTTANSKYKTTNMGIIKYL